MPIGDKDMFGNVLRLGGKNAFIWELPNGQFLFRFVDRKEVFTAKTEEKAVEWYNKIEDKNFFKLPDLPPPRLDSKVEEEGDELPVLPEGAHLLGKFESKSTPGMFHYVVRYKDDVDRCSCWPFTTNHRCGHNDFVQSILLQLSVEKLIEKPIIVRYNRE